MIKKLLRYLLKYFLLPICIFFVLFSVLFKTNINDTLFASLVFTLGINFIIGIIRIPIIIAKTIAKKNIKYEKLTKEDIFKSKEIYRELLASHSPSVLSYIDNMTLESESITITTLLNLKHKKYIDFTDNKIIKLDYSSDENLNLTEKYVLNSISNGKVNISKNTLENNIIEDALKEQLIVTKADISKSFIKQLIKIIITFVLLLIVVILTEDSSTFLGTIATIALLTYFPIGVPAYIITYFIKYNKNPYFRSKKGKEINKKLEGLKNYIKEYSLLKEKDSSSIELWEDYLIYAVIFGQNNKITEDFLKYIILN